MEPVAAAGAVDVADQHGHPVSAVPNVAASRPVDVTLVVLAVPVGAPVGLVVDNYAAGEQECREHERTEFRAIHVR